MIKIGDFASSAAALSLADYCKNQQLNVSVVVHSAEQAELWCAPEHAQQVLAELERFFSGSLCGPLSGSGMGQGTSRGFCFGISGFIRLLATVMGPRRLVYPYDLVVGFAGVWLATN